MGYTHLTEEERYQIDDCLRDGFLPSDIAEKLNRSKSTLSRELKRNRGKKGWRPRQANLIAEERLSERGSRNVKRASDTALEYAKQRLQEDQWSPEQISGRLKHDGMETISHETLYQKILEDKKVGGTLYTNLRCKKKRRKHYGSAKTSRGSIPNRVDIDKRPAIVENRKRIGDWEGDTIIGSYNGGVVIASMVERKSRFTKLAKAKNKTTEAVIDSINKKMKPLSDFVLTTTFDNGKEFSNHIALTCMLMTEVYFAKPYYSWERGLNENTNGLVRQYFPKRMSFDNISKDELQQVERKINNRPRKCLGYKTPFEIFSKSLAKRGVALRI